MSGAANDAEAVCRLRDLGSTGAASHKGVIRAVYAAALHWTCVVRRRSNSVGSLLTYSP